MPTIKVSIFYVGNIKEQLFLQKVKTYSVSDVPQNQIFYLGKLRKEYDVENVLNLYLAN